MDRIYTSGAAGSPPSPPSSPSAGYPAAGVPATGTPATKPGPWWFHMVSEELLTTIEAAGITPSGTTLGQLAKAIQSSRLMTASAAGTADAITASFSPAVTALTDGFVVNVRATAANVSTTPTFTPNSGTLSPKTIIKGADLPLAPGDISGAGHRVSLCYDATLDKWAILNPATGISQDSLGYSQSWQNVVASRALGTTYYNTTGRPIFVFVETGTATLTITVNGIVAVKQAVTSGSNAAGGAIVPPGGSYVATGNSINTWAELR